MCVCACERERLFFFPFSFESVRGWGRGGGHLKLCCHFAFLLYGLDESVVFVVSLCFDLQPGCAQHETLLWPGDAGESC